MSETLILKREPIGSNQEDIDVRAHVLPIQIERHWHPGHRGKNRRAEYLQRSWPDRNPAVRRFHAGVTKTQREIMTDKTLEALTDEEWDMIETIRENREDDGFRLLIERKYGVWAIELKSAKVPNLERGTGVDFNQAWDNMTEIIR